MLKSIYSISFYGVVNSCDEIIVYVVYIVSRVEISLLPAVGSVLLVLLVLVQSCCCNYWFLDFIHLLTI